MKPKSKNEANIENYTKLEPYKGIKKRSDSLDKIFVELKYNKKVPKYNYHSGLVAGMLINDLSILQPILESKISVDKELAMKILERLMPKAKSLVEDFNWKLGDLHNLIHQFFSEEK